MSHYRAVCLLLWFGGITKGVNAKVQTIAVKAGGEAILNCQLQKSEDVVQVTWQKVSPETNLATCSKYFDPRVNPEFRDKVEFKDARLQNSSIMIRNVTQQDEGCYRCLFNSQRHMAIICKTCLQIYVELDEPIPLVTNVKEFPSNTDRIWISVPVVLVWVAVITFLFIKKPMKSLCCSDSEKNEDEEVGKELQDTHKTPPPRTPPPRTPSPRTPFMEVNEETSTDSLRKRESAMKEPSANPRQKTSAVKRLNL